MTETPLTMMKHIHRLAMRQVVFGEWSGELILLAKEFDSEECLLIDNPTDARFRDRPDDLKDHIEKYRPVAVIHSVHATTEALGEHVLTYLADPYDLNEYVIITRINREGPVMIERVEPTSPSDYSVWLRPMIEEARLHDVK